MLEILFAQHLTNARRWRYIRRGDELLATFFSGREALILSCDRLEGLLLCPGGAMVTAEAQLQRIFGKS